MGTGEMRGDTIRIRTDDGVVEFKRSQLVTIIPGSGRELDFWSLNLSVGLNGQSGNTDQLSLNTSAGIDRETALTRFKADYTGNIALQEDDLTANNHRGTVSASFYVTRRFFLVFPYFEAFQDGFQNISYRLTPSVGVGYNLVDRKWLKWKIGPALGYQLTKFLSVSEDEANPQSDAALQFNTDIGKTNHHLSSTLSFDFWGPLDLDTTFQWDRVEQPQTTATGTTPVPNDYRIIVSFALDL